MSTDADLFQAIVDAPIEAHGQSVTEWLECGGRAAIECGVAGWRSETAEDAWLDRREDVLVLRALQHIEHVVELAGGARIKARIRAFVDEDWNGRRQGAMARIGEVFAHELLLGDTGEPFDSIKCTRFASTARRYRARTTSSRGTRRWRFPAPRPALKCASPRRDTSSAGSRSSIFRDGRARRRRWRTRATSAGGRRSTSAREEWRRAYPGPWSSSFANCCAPVVSLGACRFSGELNSGFPGDQNSTLSVCSS